MAERDQLVTKRDVDVADAGRVRVEIEQRERSEGRGHIRHRDQFGDRASWPPAAPGRAALRRAGEDAQSTQRHVEPVLAPRAGGNLRQIVVGDLFKRAVAARDQHAETDGHGFILRAPALPWDRRGFAPEAIVRLTPLVICGQPCNPPLKRHAAQPRPRRDRAPSQHQGAWPTHPLSGLRPIIVGEPARPDRLLEVVPPSLQGPTGTRHEGRQECRTSVMRLPPFAGRGGEAIDERVQIPAERDAVVVGAGPAAATRRGVTDAVMVALPWATASR